MLTSFHPKVVLNSICWKLASLQVTQKVDCNQVSFANIWKGYMGDLNCIFVAKKCLGTAATCKYTLLQFITVQKKRNICHWKTMNENNEWKTKLVIS